LIYNPDQERCLSQRLLFLTETQAYFVCGKKVFCEDTVTEGIDPGWYHNIVHYRPSRTPKGQFILGDISSQTGFIIAYHWHLRSYSTRRITYQSDTLDAFRGVLNTMNLKVQDNIWQGLPEKYLDAALLWTTCGTSKRREVETDSNSAPRPIFPSWSWLGWLGEIETALGRDIGIIMEGFQPTVDWYLMNEHDQIIQMETEPFMGSRYGSKPPKLFAQGLKVSRSLPYDVQRRLQPRKVALMSLPAWRYPPYLLGWTRSARFQLCLESVSETDITPSTTIWPTNQSTFRVLDTEGRSIGQVTIDLDPGVCLFDPAKKYEFIALSRAWWTSHPASLNSIQKELLERVTSRKGPWYLVNVMLIVRDGGFAERRGIGFIHERHWEAARSRETFVKLQ
jgi:hypothetical protein